MKQIIFNNIDKNFSIKLDTLINISNFKVGYVVTDRNMMKVGELILNDINPDWITSSSSILLPFNLNLANNEWYNISITLADEFKSITHDYTVYVFDSVFKILGVNTTSNVNGLLQDHPEMNYATPTDSEGFDATIDPYAMYKVRFDSSLSETLSENAVLRVGRTLVTATSENEFLVENFISNTNRKIVKVIQAVNNEINFDLVVEYVYPNSLLKLESQEGTISDKSFIKFKVVDKTVNTFPIQVVYKVVDTVKNEVIDSYTNILDIVNTKLSSTQSTITRVNTSDVYPLMKIGGVETFEISFANYNRALPILTIVNVLRKRVTDTDYALVSSLKVDSAQWLSNSVHNFLLADGRTEVVLKNLVGDSKYQIELTPKSYNQEYKLVVITSLYGDSSITEIDALRTESMLTTDLPSDIDFSSYSTTDVQLASWAPKTAIKFDYKLVDNVNIYPDIPAFRITRHTDGLVTTISPNASIFSANGFTFSNSLFNLNIKKGSFEYNFELTPAEYNEDFSISFDLDLTDAVKTISSAKVFKTKTFTVADLSSNLVPNYNYANPTVYGQRYSFKYDLKDKSIRPKINSVELFAKDLNKNEVTFKSIKLVDLTSVNLTAGYSSATVSEDLFDYSFSVDSTGQYFFVNLTPKQYNIEINAEADLTLYGTSKHVTFSDPFISEVYIINSIGDYFNPVGVGHANAAVGSQYVYSFSFDKTKVISPEMVRFELFSASQLDSNKTFNSVYDVTISQDWLGNVNTIGPVQLDNSELELFIEFNNVTQTYYVKLTPMNMNRIYSFEADFKMLGKTKVTKNLGDLTTGIYKISNISPALLEPTNPISVNINSTYSYVLPVNPDRPFITKFWVKDMETNTEIFRKDSLDDSFWSTGNSINDKTTDNSLFFTVILDSVNGKYDFKLNPKLYNRKYKFYFEMELFGEVRTFTTLSDTLVEEYHVEELNDFIMTSSGVIVQGSSANYELALPSKEFIPNIRKVEIHGQDYVSLGGSINTGIDPVACAVFTTAQQWKTSNTSSTPFSDLNIYITYSAVSNKYIISVSPVSKKYKYYNITVEVELFDLFGTSYTEKKTFTLDPFEAYIFDTVAASTTMTATNVLSYNNSLMEIDNNVLRYKFKSSFIDCSTTLSMLLTSKESPNSLAGYSADAITNGQSCGGIILSDADFTDKTTYNLDTTSNDQNPQCSNNTIFKAMFGAYCVKSYFEKPVIYYYTNSTEVTVATGDIASATEIVGFNMNLRNATVKYAFVSTDNKYFKITGADLASQQLVEITPNDFANYSTFTSGFSINKLLGLKSILGSGFKVSLLITGTGDNTRGSLNYLEIQTIKRHGL